MKKTFFLATLLLIIWVKGQSQELTVGDAIPDLKNMRYFKDGKYMDVDLNLNDKRFKDKLIIFDFWAPGCAPCIRGLPKMDSLQKKFGNKIMILPVVGWEKRLDAAKIYDTEKWISDFWTKNSFCKRSTSLGTLVENKTNLLLYKYFPKAGLPYEVWVKNGKIIGITGADHVNEKEISEILRGEEKKWVISPGSSDFYKNYDLKIPLQNFINGNQSVNSRLMYSSVIADYLLGFRSLNNQLLRDSNSIKLTVLNRTIPDLFKWALRPKIDHRFDIFYSNRVILEVKNKARYFNVDHEYGTEWTKSNAFCYQLIVPNKYNDDTAYEFMKQDLNRFFGVNGRLEKRRVKCWIVTRNTNRPGAEQEIIAKWKNKNDSLSKAEGQGYFALKEEINKVRGWQENPYYSISDLCASLNWESMERPVINESGYSGDLAFLFRIGPKLAFEDYQKQLAKNGFDLKVAEREIEMLVITENGYKD